MAKINNEYRQVNAPTDVLSFPFFERDGEFVPDVQTRPFTLGDILLCPAVVKRNALEHRVSEESELALILFHGMLHLLAWDHDTQEKQEKMWRVQERFRDLFLKSIADKNVAGLDKESK